MNRAERERSEIAEHQKWCTEHLFGSDEAWEQQLASVRQQLGQLSAYRGRLADPSTILSCLQQTFAMQQRVRRLASYAWRRHDEDTRQSPYQAMRELAEKLSIAFREHTAFIEPELVALPQQTLQQLRGDPAFADYRRYLAEVLRLKPHILSPPEETLLASASLMREAGHNAFSTFCGADLTFPRIQDERGKPVQLSQALFARYRTSADRSVRKRAFQALFTTFGRYRNTLASLLGAQINAHIVYARARRYSSALEAALDSDELPVAVYHTMIKAVNEHLPALHRYLRLRRRLLGLKSLRYFDLYAPMVQRVRLRFAYTEARHVLAEAMAPLGHDYCQALAHGLAHENGWIDLCPNKGKRSGAYMDGSAYGVHPYVLCNYLEDYNSLSTVAHEMGHAMHSHYSNQAQPYPKADYAIFVAEVASTLNESLLVDHLLQQQTRRDRKLFLLAEQLEGFRQTVFRQAMFAEFELAVYSRVEKGEALTADVLSQIYLELVRRYYGHPGVVRIDDLYAIEWAYIPHFYYNYYVFQYVTGMTAATALAEQIGREGQPARDRYITHLLSAGGSDAPIALLQRAGVDLTSTKPYDVAMAAFTRALEQAETLA